MKCITILAKIFLYMLIFTTNLYAQYDTGTVIYAHTNNTNLTSVLNNYKVVDFDGDHYSDIIMIKDANTTSTSQLTWYKGDGSGNFSAQANILSIDDAHKENEIFYADMNGDGVKDIVFQNSNTSFKVLLNDGQGNIFAQIDNEVIAVDLYDADLKEVADMDGDGDMDALFRGKTLNTAEFIYRENCLIGYNNGSGSFSNYSYLNDDDMDVLLLIKTGDIDGDGDLDIIYSGNENAVGAGGFGPTYYISPYIKVYENLGENGFEFKTDLPIPELDNSEPAFTHIKVEDINNDGNDELLIEHAIWDACLDPIHKHFCTYFYQFQILDYNSQSETFITLEEYNTWLHGYEMNELMSIAEEFYDDAFLIQFGHQNTDNNLDILSVNVPQGRLQWYLGDGNGNFNNTQIVNFNSQYSSIRPALRVADIDNDTDLDVFVLLNDQTSSTLTVFKNLALSPICVPVLDLVATPLTNGIYQAGTTLVSSGNVVSGNNNVILKAGGNIRLQIGFKAPANSTVKIRISSCN